MDGTFEYTAFEYTGQDFYCDVALRNIGKLNIVHDGGLVLAFQHTRPFWNVHIVVVPKRHIDSLTTVSAEDETHVRALFCVVQSVAHDVERQYGAASVLTNLGTYQDSKHLHVHVHSGSRRSEH